MNVSTVLKAGLLSVCISFVWIPGAAGAEQFLPREGLYEIRSAADDGFVVDARNCTVSSTVWSSLQLFRPLHVRQQEFVLEKDPEKGYRIICLETGRLVTEERSQKEPVAASASESEQNPEPEIPESSAVLRNAFGSDPDPDLLLSGQSPVRTDFSAYFVSRQPEIPAEDVSYTDLLPDDFQRWVIEPAEDGAFFYIRSASGKYLTLEQNRAYNGAPLILSPFTGRPGQRWLLRPQKRYPSGAADTDAVNPYKKDGKNETTSLSIRFGDHFEILDTETLASWVRVTDQHTVTWNEDQIDHYLAELSEIYDTVDRTRLFHTSSGENILITPGSLGWEIDRRATKQEILDTAALPGKHIVDPVWNHSTGSFIWDLEQGNDIGDSYVEIDLSAQHVWFYKYGELVLDTDCVTGTAGTERETPPGAYAIFYMQSPAVLHGEDYETPVTYWMPFNNGIGLHDADWRWSFGGNIYTYDGSHGCINLPHEAAGRIYESVYVGYPVICY